jgi:hypothetical protein
MKEKALKLALEQIGQKLIVLRKTKGYSSHEGFALDFDLPRVQYWRMETGKANFTIRSLTKILAIHKLSLIQFFSLLDRDVEKIIKGQV